MVGHFYSQYDNKSNLILPPKFTIVPRETTDTNLPLCQGRLLTPKFFETGLVKLGEIQNKFLTEMFLSEQENRKKLTNNKLLDYITILDTFLFEF